MIKRVKATKIGDVFEVKISDTEKRYMQYVVSDMNCFLFSAMGHPFQQFAEMRLSSSVTSGSSLVWSRTDLRLLSYGLT